MKDKHHKTYLNKILNKVQQVIDNQNNEVIK